jgi:carbonic anhydrase/acetyltransferase-like protein (isoleucine patch superfamily)
MSKNNIFPFKDSRPFIAKDTFIAPGAFVIGDVTLAEKVSIWYNVVVRGDVNSIKIGTMSNIQDNTTIHADSGRSGLKADGLPTIVGNCVSVGHNCVLHACTIEDYCLIGMGAIILDGSVVGRGSIVGANSVVTKGTIIPPCSVVVGTPAKVIKTMTEEEAIAARLDQAQHYYRLAMNNKNSLRESME